jgi:hypothetical protein
MAQAKKKTATRTAKKACAKRQCCKKQQSRICYKKYEKGQQSNMLFVVSMSFLAATLLFADLLMMTA